MKTFRAKRTNLNKPVVCKIVSTGEANNENFSYKARFDNYEKLSFECLIANRDKEIKDRESEFFFQIASTDMHLDEGDILLLDPSGAATVLYTSNSPHNAVLLTNRCNSRCLMCPQPPKTDDDDYIGLSIKMISLMKPETEVLGVTGGEPTLVWDGLIEVLLACRSLIPETEIHVLTNARLLKDYEKAKQLANAGGNNLFLCIPLYADVDTIHDSIVRSNGAFWETIEAIHNMARLHVRLEIRNVVMKLNYHRLEPWSEFIYRGFPFADHIALMGLEPFGLACKNFDKVWIDPVDYMSFLKKAVLALNRRNLSVSIYNHQLCTLPEELWHFSRKSISEWKNVYFPECSECRVKKECGGFFTSSKNIAMKGIKKIVI